MMKKVIAMVLTVVLLAGCSSGETAQQATENGLKAIKGMDTAVMTTYFGSDVLRESGGDDMPQEAMNAFAKHLSYEIISVEEKDGEATAKLKITNVNMQTVLSDVMTKMIGEAFSYALLPQDQQPTEEEMDSKLEAMLIEAMEKTDAELITAEVELKLTKKDKAWSIDVTDAFMDAIFGGMMSVSNSL